MSSTPQLAAPPAPDELPRMSLIMHLHELRKRFLWSLAFTALAFFPCWAKVEEIFNFLEKPIKVFECSEEGMNVAVIGNVVSKIDVWRREKWRHPNRVHSQLLQIIQPRRDALQIANLLEVFGHPRARGAGPFRADDRSRRASAAHEAFVTSPRGRAEGDPHARRVRALGPELCVD